MLDPLRSWMKGNKDSAAINPQVHDLREEVIKCCQPSRPCLHWHPMNKGPFGPLFTLDDGAGYLRMLLRTS